MLYYAIILMYAECMLLIMKKTILFILVFLLCTGAVASTFFLIDREDPKITVKGTPTLGCKVTFDDLMNYAIAEDNKGIKSFFIEEKSLNDIADYNSLTYVAIDESNNVTKKQVSVNVDPNVKTYHIEVLKPLQAQIKKTLKTEEYLVLKNECGWNVEDSFVIEGVDYTQAEEYDAKITVKKHNNVEPVYTTVEVDDFTAPRIILTEETYKDWVNMVYTDEYFMGFIDHIEDDNDDPDELLKRVTTNWREIMMPFSSGYMENTGTYTITYKVTDSDGNTGRATLRLMLRKPEYAAPSATPSEGEQE